MLGVRMNERVDVGGVLPRPGRVYQALAVVRIPDELQTIQEPCTGL
jgi:hypothetical protein